MTSLPYLTHQLPYTCIPPTLDVHESLECEPKADMSCNFKFMFSGSELSLATTTEYDYETFARTSLSVFVAVRSLHALVSDPALNRPLMLIPESAWVLSDMAAALPGLDRNSSTMAEI
jgi:hypothetical protein